jgi:hypothetical protein
MRPRTIAQSGIVTQDFRAYLDEESTSIPKYYRWYLTRKDSLKQILKYTNYTLFFLGVVFHVSYQVKKTDWEQGKTENVKLYLSLFN